MAVRATLKPTTIVYTVGPGPDDDLTPAKYQALVEAVGDWFAKIRKTKEPVALAKFTIDCCLRGVKPSDQQPWPGAETQPLAKRIRSACRFDLDTMKPLLDADEESRLKKEREKAAEKRRKERAAVDTNYPAEYRLPPTKAPTAASGAPRALVDPSDASYGDDPLTFFTTAEHADRDRMKAAYLKKFPQLDNIAAEPKLEQLLDLVVLQKRLRFRNAKGEKNQKVTEKEMTEMIGQVVALEKAMGIDPVTLKKTQNEKEGGSIGDAVRRFQAMGDNYVKLRERLFAEEMLLAYQMYHTPSPRGNMGGYQLDDVGLYGFTKSRVVTCPKCGTENFAGLSIAEIEAWLFANGHAEEDPLSEAELVALTEAVAQAAALEPEAHAPLVREFPEDTL